MPSTRETIEAIVAEDSKNDASILHHLNIGADYIISNQRFTVDENETGNSLEQKLHTDFHKHYPEYVHSATEYLKEKIHDFRPEVLIVLGTGQGGHVSELFDDGNSTVIPYELIPGFIKVGVSSHEGQLHFGKIKGTNAVIMEGRKHYYEVADFKFGMKLAAMPVDVMTNLGVNTMLLTSAAGGLYNGNIPGAPEQPKSKIGDIYVVDTHWKSFSAHPCRGAKYTGNEHIPERDEFAVMSEPYDKYLSSKVEEFIKKTFVPQSIYTTTHAVNSGPDFETPIDARTLISNGYHSVGMTIHEVLLGRFYKTPLNIVSLACITNTYNEQGIGRDGHEEITNAGKITSPKVREIIPAFIEAYQNRPVPT
ncbi:MAG: purine-nucleoside phosphorylase [Nanoarchaeota archaeon]|nr:purine-nucleoside phosphorylase [Nanoarchaeota archaeon]